ncbi:transcriptional regulator [Caldimonas taiwanensis]|uniref:transcriptional regulator n=1 Tax=Caldimonas taiwanensis TaxID=307483 RepID=UPI000A071437|nr:YdaS family helix-turn-helix protein [Caldimonas taiwanensis]
MSPLERAISICGGVTALASAIGVASSAPSMWKSRRKVPAEHCPAIERETRRRGHAVTCEELRPDVAWDVLRHQAAPLHHEAA